MKNAILIRGARQLLTLRGPASPRRGVALRELGIIQDGAVLIRDGRILAVGQGRRVENLADARDAVEIDATRHLVLPGFVDSHTHLVSGQPRLAEFEMRVAGRDGDEILPSAPGSFRHPECPGHARPSLHRKARALVEACIRNGTTTLESKPGHGPIAGAS